MFDISNGVNDIAKIVPEAYKDLVQPTAREVGKFIAFIPKAVNAALEPLEKWIETRRYNVEEIKKLLEKKLENINPDCIETPEAYIAVPALQAIGYSMDNEELRNLYANLLATSMIKDIKWRVHPSYVEIIKQLTPDEAKLLKILDGKIDSYPLIDIHVVDGRGNFKVYLRNFTTLAIDVCENANNMYSYLDNLARLKIIEIPFGVRMADDDVYKPLEEYHEIKTLLSRSDLYPLPEDSKWEIKRKKFDITNYGREFMKVCVSDSIIDNEENLKFQ